MTACFSAAMYCPVGGGSRRAGRHGARALLDSARTPQPVAIIAFVQAVDLNMAAGARCVYEFAASYVDSHVRDACTGGMKENEIALFHLSGRHLPPMVELLRRRMRQIHSLPGVYVARKSGAIKSAAGRPSEM